jgi:PAS domain S-box-containing protein
MRATTPSLEALLEHSLDVLAIVDAEGRVEYVSPSSRRMLGWDPGELQGRHVLNLIHPRDVERVVGGFAGVTPDAPGVELELRLRARDGRWRSLEAHVSAAFSDGERDVAYVTLRDVTELRAEESAARRVATRLETLVASASTGILMVDGLNRIVVVNQAFCDLFQIPAPPESLLGADTTPTGGNWADHLFADPEASLLRQQEIVRAGRPVRGDLLPLADGRILARDYLPVAEQADGHLWILRDVTAYKRLEADLERARDEAVAAARAKGEFLATMSHEIRTPLSGILGAAELLADTPLDGRARELTDVILDAAGALGGLIGDILDLSRIEAGKVLVDDGDYEPRAVIAAVAALIRPTLAGRPVTLSCAVDGAVPPVLRGDAVRLRQVLINIVGNAAKFTEQGAVRIAAAAAGSWLEIAVSDTGAGIEPSELARVFEPYVRGTGSRAGGTGLGLDIARRLTRAMGGEVCVESEPGAGSTFTVRLPLVAGRAEPASAPAAAVVPLGRGRVLAAEDDPALRAVLARQLERLGVEARVVEHGAAAVDAWREGGWDCVLLDVNMPVLDGLAAARAIRAAEAERQQAPTPLVALTADALPEDVERTRAAGIDEHLAKPLAIATLRATLARHLPAGGAPSGDPATAPPGAPATATAASRAAPPAGRALPPLVDRAVLADLAEGLGGADAVAPLLTLWRDQLAGRLVALRDAVEAGDPEQVRVAAHALRSPSAGFGLARVAAAAGALERAARAGELVDARVLLAAVDAAALATDAAL